MSVATASFKEKGDGRLGQGSTEETQDSKFVIRHLRILESLLFMNA